MRRRFTPGAGRTAVLRSCIPHSAFRIPNSTSPWVAFTIRSMRLSTAIILLVFLASAAALVLSVRSVGEGDMVDGKRIYRFAAWGAAEEMRELQQRVIDPINAAAEGFRIEIVAIPGDYNTKLLTMIAGGRPPDFFYLSQVHVPALAQQGALLDITDRVEACEAAVCQQAGYYPAVLRQYRWNGRLYGLPWIAQPVVLYCNVDLFEAAGVALPDATWDWMRFVEAGQKLTRDTDGDGRTDVWAFAQKRWPPLQIWVWQNDASLIDRRSGRVRLTDPKVLEAANFKAGLIHRWHIAPPLPQVGSAENELFRAGRCAMFMGGAADDLDRLPGLNVVMRQVPAGPDGTHATLAWSAGLHIRPGVRDPDLAFRAYTALLDGIQHWKTPAPRRDLALQIEHLEPRKAAAADVIRAAMETMRGPVGRLRSVEFDDVLWKEFEEPLLRYGTPAQELAPRAQQRLEALQ